MCYYLFFCATIYFFCATIYFFRLYNIKAYGKAEQILALLIKQKILYNIKGDIL